MKQNNGSNAFGRKLDKAKDAVKKLKRFKEDHNKEFKVAVAVIVIAAAALLYQENPVLDTGFVEAMHLNINSSTVKLKLRSGNCN